MTKRLVLPWSPYQKAIFLDIAKGQGHTIVEARAGSSKTTSIIEGFRYIPRGKKTIALAFNKPIQKELEERAPSYVKCFTFHSLGFQAIKRRFGTVELDDYKVFNIVKGFSEVDDDYDTITNICDTIAYCKYSLTDVPSGIDDIINRFGIDTCAMERKDFIRVVIQALGKDKALTNKIDYNDMCWFPFVYDLPFEKQDMVFVDEYQDLNKSQMVMARKACKSDGRIIMVGDKKQELYSWRLSDTSVVHALKDEPNTKVLSLPITYRCPKKIVELVKPWVPDFVCAENAKEGEIHEISLNKLYDTAKPGCFVLSRTNSPLIKVCMSFIRNNVKANIRGRDVGKHLTSLIRKSKKQRIDAFLKWLAQWKDAEVETLKAKGISPDNVLDRYECLVNLCEEFSSLDEVKAKIDELFDDSDEKNIIVLSTVHRAKGLQRDDVFLLRWTFRAWFEDIEDTNEPNEEMNIAYVGASRCAHRLYLVSKYGT